MLGFKSFNLVELPRFELGTSTMSKLVSKLLILLETAKTLHHLPSTSLQTKDLTTFTLKDEHSRSFRVIFWAHTS